VPPAERSPPPGARCGAKPSETADVSLRTGPAAPCSRLPLRRHVRRIAVNGQCRGSRRRARLVQKEHNIHGARLGEHRVVRLVPALPQRVHDLHTHHPASFHDTSALCREFLCRPRKAPAPGAGERLPSSAAPGACRLAASSWRLAVGSECRRGPPETARPAAATAWLRARRARAPRLLRAVLPEGCGLRRDDRRVVRADLVVADAARPCAHIHLVHEQLHRLQACRAAATH